MSLRFLGAADGRRLQALRALRRLSALGFTETDIPALIREHRRRRPPQSVDPGRPMDKACRLRLAQWAIRAMMALGFTEKEIAELVGVNHATIAHLLSSDGSRSVSREMAFALRDAVDRIGGARLMMLLKGLQITVLDTCCVKGTDLNRATGFEIAQQIRVLVRNALLLPTAPVPDVAGIRAFLAQIGDPASATYIFGAPSVDRSASDEERIAQLLSLEHELEHILQRFQTQRKRLERRRRAAHASQIPSSGRIA
jgi:transcriptional regulator with XRE-family HTH domain